MRKVGFIIDGGSKLGLGHFSRSSQVASFMKTNGLAEVFFVVVDKGVKQRLEQLGFKVYIFGGDTVSHLRRELSVLKDGAPNVVVVDVRNDSDISELIGRIRQVVDSEVVVVGTESASRLLADKAIYPVPSGLVDDLKWAGYTGKVFSGLKYLPIRSEFFDSVEVGKTRGLITISIGAADPHNITCKLMDMLSGRGLEVQVILGPAFQHERAVQAITEKDSSTFRVFKDPRNYCKLVAKSSLIFTGAGTSVYEFLVYKVPIYAIGHYPLNSKNCNKLQELGYCQYLGLYNEFTKERVDSAIQGQDVQGAGSKIERPDKGGVKRFSQVVINE